MLQKTTFSSDHLPGDLTDRTRFNLWRDIYTAEIGSVDFGVAEDTPFRASIEAVGVGSLIYAKMSGSINRVARTRQGVRADSNDHYSLVINLCDAPIGGTYRGEELEIGVGGAFLHDAAETQEMNGRESNSWANIIIPRQVMQGAFGPIGDRQGLEIKADHAPLRLLRSYLTLLDGGAMPTSRDLHAHISQTMLDLVGLTTGAKGDNAELAGMRGLRAARLQSVLERIRAGFSDPNLSGQVVAQQLGLSVRYVHDLLQETGIGFSERVLTLRLNKARNLLTDPRFRASRIGEIAHEAGFSDISHFNRSFRRQFGCTPGSAR